MRAIILAGGSGTRLRPLTCDRPKPMVRVCGRPVIEYCFDMILKSRLPEATVTLGYLAESISEYYGYNYGSMALNYTIEENPLGTAGAVKLACAGKAEDIVVLSGDAVCDFDLSAMIEDFKRTGADALIAVKKVDDPREYGLVICESDGRVSGFIEKPSYLQAVSEYANTGIYILSERAINLIPKGVSYDFAKDLFPLMLLNKMAVYASPQSGYWCDIGDIDSYIRCQGDLLSGNTKCSFKSNSPPEGDYTIKEPVYFGKGVEIGSGSVIEGPCVIDDNVILGAGCSVKGSVLLPGARLGRGVSTSGAVADTKADFCSGAMVFEGGVVGQGSRVGSRASVSGHVRIWPEKDIPAGSKVTKNLKVGGYQRMQFGERGIVGEIGVELVPELCVRIGAAAATALGGSIAIAHADSSACQALGDALSSGVRSAGENVLRIGAAPSSVLGFCVGRSDAKIGMYVDESGLRLMSVSGLEISRAEERGIEGALLRDEYRRVLSERFGTERGEAFWTELYSDMLRTEIGRLDGIFASVVTADKATGQFAGKLLLDMGARPGGISFYFDPGMEQLLIETERRTIPKSRVLLIAAMNDILRGDDVALPAWMPPASEEMAVPYGGKILRYSASPADNSDIEARRMAMASGWQQDPIYIMLRVLQMMIKTGKTADELDDAIPSFTEKTREVAVSGNPAWLVGRLGGKRLPDGIQLDMPGGYVMVRPTKRGNAIRLLAQAHSQETAAELCDFIAEKIVGELEV